MQAAVQRKIPPGMEMSVNVLTSGYWPSYPIVEATLPQELATYSQVISPPLPLPSTPNLAVSAR